MEIKFKNDHFDNLNLFTDDNIIIIHAGNNLGKTNFLESFLREFKRGNIQFSFLEEPYNEAIFIPEIPDLKKELDLSKQSTLRKSFKEIFKENINFESFELFDLINQMLEQKGVWNKLNDLLKIDFENYKIKLNEVASDIDSFIDYFFFLTINNNDGEKDVSSSFAKILYYEILFFNKNIKNKILLIDCPETLLDKNYLNLFFDKLKYLSKNNLIILSTRSSHLLKYSSNVYFMRNGLYQSLKINDSFVFNYLAMNEYLKNEFNNYDLLKSSLEKIIVSDDLIKTKNDINNQLVLLFDLIDWNNNKLLTTNLSFFSEKFIILLFLFMRSHELNYSEIKKYLPIKLNEFF